jgi:hypothetical protein
MDSESIVREVFRRVRARDESVADLYAEGATLAVGDVVHRGRDRIREDFYRPLLADDPPNPEVQAVFSQDDLFVALLSVTWERGGPALQVADVFTVANGEIGSLRICLQAPQVSS